MVHSGALLYSWPDKDMLANMFGTPDLNNPDTSPLGIEPDEYMLESNEDLPFVPGLSGCHWYSHP
jgi:hypothetical protein